MFQRKLFGDEKGKNGAEICPAVTKETLLYLNISYYVCLYICIYFLEFLSQQRLLDRLLCTAWVFFQLLLVTCERVISSELVGPYTCMGIES